MTKHIICTNCEGTDTPVNDEVIQPGDRCPNCGAIGTLVEED